MERTQTERKKSKGIVHQFHYAAKRDVISTTIWSIISPIVILSLKAIYNYAIKIDTSDDSRFLDLITFWFSVLTIILSLIATWIGVYTRTYQRLIIKESAVVYKCGWLSKKTVSIPSNRILSCKKYSSPLQRICKTMDISVTNSGDGEEFRFRCIRNGAKAYLLLLKMVEENRK